MTTAALSESVAALFQNRRFREAFTQGVQGLQEAEDELSRGESMRTRRWIGLAAVAMGRIQVAIPHLHLAHEWDPLDYEVGMALGELLCDDGRFDEGWEVLETILLHHRDQMPVDARRDVCSRLAESYLSSGNPEAAIRRLEESNRLRAGDPYVSSLLGVAYDRVGEGQKAIALHRVELEAQTNPMEKAARALELAQLLSSNQRDGATELLENVAFELGETLDAHPRRLELFERQTELLDAAEAWTSLHSAYRAMIERIGDGGLDVQSLLALLWRKTGDVSLTRLGLQERAATEYALAEEHKAAADLAEPLYVPTGAHEETSPVEELWHQLSESSDDGEIALAYATALADRGDWQYAQSVLDVVAAMGVGDAGVQDAARRRRRGAREFRRPLTDDLRNRYLRPKSRRAALDALFHIAFHVLGPYVMEDLETLGLNERDRLTRESKLPVVRALRQTSANLGFPRPPAAFSHSGQGVRSANTTSPVILIGTDRVAASDDGMLRFELGYLLTMLQPRFVFAGTMQTSGLLSVVESLTGVELPSDEVADPATTERYRAFGRASIEERWVEPLQDATRRLNESVSLPRLDDWLEGVSVEAAHTALICAGDVFEALPAADMFLPSDAPSGSSSHRSLLAFAMSLECFRLRESLGVLP
jgi:Flp pilus assembly protein TadD